MTKKVQWRSFQDRKVLIIEIYGYSTIQLTSLVEGSSVFLPKGILEKKILESRDINYDLHCNLFSHCADVHEACFSFTGSC